MKRNVILIALTAVMALSASAENQLVYCIVCGNDGFIDTTTPGAKNWEYIQSRGGKGYVCPAAKCRKQAASWLIADEKLARESAAEMLSDIKKSKELKKAVRTICRKERYALLATKGQPDKQIEFMNKLIAFCAKHNCHAEDIWFEFAAQADIKAVKYFWPDPADEKVYLASKTQMEENAKPKKSGGKKFTDGDLLNSLFSGDSGVRMSKKSGPCALAIGRAKKDNSIRFVESENFAAGVLAAALANDRKDVVAYLLKQTGGTDESFRRKIADGLMTAAGDVAYARIKIGEQLAAVEKAKKEADDKFDIEKIDKQIKFLKKQRDGMKPVVVSADTLAAVLSDMTPSEAAQYCYKAANWGVRGSDGAEAFQEVLEAQSKSTLSAEVAAVSNGNMQKMMRAMRGGDKVRLTSLCKTLDDICAKSSGDVGKWYKWRAGLSKHWRAGIIDKWLPALVSANKIGEWEWNVEQGLPSVEHPGYSSTVAYNPLTNVSALGWEWCPGIPDVSRPGYFAAAQEGTFVWKAGIPDPERIGMVSGAKEGEWKLAPGFQKQADGKVRWVAGLTDPARPGIVSTEKMFCWMPDGNHLWSYSEDNKEEMKRRGKPYLSAEDYDVLLNARNDNLKVVKEHKVLHPAADKALSGKRRY